MIKLAILNENSGVIDAEIQKCACGCGKVARSRFVHGHNRATVSPEARFWAKVDTDGPIPAHRPELGRCWLWTGSLNEHGYGKFMLMRISEHGRRAPMKAHRYAYESLRGPIPEGLEPDHLCINPPCINRWHQEPVTHQENMMRGPTNVASRSARHRRALRCLEFPEVAL